jgi:hypothetical protein
MKKLEVDVPRLDMTDPDKWAQSPVVYTAWLRQACPQLGLDAKRLITASVLIDIIGDDINSFGYYYMPDMIEMAQRHIQIRMEHEIKTPETPRDIRKQLLQVSTELKGFDWKSAAGYTKAVTIWKTGVRDYVQGEIESNIEYQNMIDDYHADTQTLMPQWRKFLYGRKKTLPSAVS